MTINDTERLVGDNPQEANQPTKPDLHNDMLVVLMPDNSVAIGDPSPQGKVIGQYVPVDGDYGVIEWSEGWDPVTLQQHCSELHSEVERANRVASHLRSAIRWHVEVLGYIMLGSKRQDERGVKAIREAVRLLSETPCQLCELEQLADEGFIEFMEWIAQRASLTQQIVEWVQEAPNNA